jgi:N-methylhydantoinase B
MSTNFDAATLEVLWTRLISVVDEAAKAIVRTSFSNLSNEANDFACVLTDAHGDLLAQNSGSIPSFIGTLPRTVRHFIDRYGADGMAPGDVLCTNNPWQGTGHLNDVCIVRPLFRDGRLVAFAATAAHVPDIGGRIRGVENRELFEEGFHIPLMKIMTAGGPDETFFQLLRAQVRTPDQTVGDIHAQIAANALMEARLMALMTDYGLAELDTLSAVLNGRCEAAMRQAIARLPDGEYAFALETDGLDAGAPFTFAVTLDIDGETLRADFAGSSAVQPRAVNCPYCYTFAMTAYAVKCALLPDLPNNAGMYRTIEVTAPENSIVNPLPPAPVGARAVSGHYVPVTVFGALARVIPERVMAGAGSPLWNCTQSGLKPDGTPYATNQFFNGGLGATARKDGESAVSWPSNISSTPVEVAEQFTPFFFHHKRLREGSGGAGRQRGGLGQDIVMESRSDTPITVTFMAERTLVPAPGLAGGGAGGLGRVAINGQSVDDRVGHRMDKGDMLLISTPGGGGYGAPEERDAEDRARDERDGYA